MLSQNNLYTGSTKNVYITFPLYGEGDILDNSIQKVAEAFPGLLVQKLRVIIVHDKFYNMLTIGLIDSQVIMRLGLSQFLHDRMKDVEISEASSLNEFMLLPRPKRPDLIILGNNFNTRRECLDAVIFLRRQFPGTLLVIYDDHLRQNLAVLYFKAGANGYLLKQNVAGEIVNCINTVLNKKNFLCPVLLENLSKCIPNSDSGTGKTQKLTARESEIAKYLTEGMTTSWIANTLGRKPSTISTIKNNIFRKMHVENVVQLKREYTF